MVFGQFNNGLNMIKQQEVLELLKQGYVKSKHYLVNDSNNIWYITGKGCPKNSRKPVSDNSLTYDDIVSLSQTHDIYINISPYVINSTDYNQNVFLF